MCKLWVGTKHGTHAQLRSLYGLRCIWFHIPGCPTLVTRIWNTCMNHALEWNVITWGQAKCDLVQFILQMHGECQIAGLSTINHYYTVAINKKLTFRSVSTHVSTMWDGSSYALLRTTRNHCFTFAQLWVHLCTGRWNNGDCWPCRETSFQGTASPEKAQVIVAANWSSRRPLNKHSPFVLWCLQGMIFAGSRAVTTCEIMADLAPSR